MDDVVEDDLFLQGKPIFEEFTCPICFELIKDCGSTPCGHSFCRTCLDECLNRKESCPSCNAPCKRTATFLNKHFDRLLAILLEQKTKASREHFARLLKPIADHTKPNDGSNVAHSNPIQETFHKHLMKSLATYEEYLKKLGTVAEKSAVEETNKYESKLAELKKRGASSNDLATLKSHHSNKLASIHETYNVTVMALQVEFDGFLEKNLVNPSFLPVQVIVLIEHTGARYPLLLNPTDTIKDVKKWLLTKPADAKSPELITRISKTRNSFELRPPFHKHSPSNGGAAAPSSSSSNAKSTTTVKMDGKERRPLTQVYDIFPGSIIALLGPPIVKLQVKECFKTSFDAAEEESHKCEFKKCVDCNKNWICKNCAESCHNGHTLTPHVAEQPWKSPLCYCSKTGNCTLFKK